MVEEALRDLRNRTLARLDGDFAKLVYLASTRDYNTGRYVHDGLSFGFPEAIVERAMAAAHREVFASLVLSPLRTFVAQVEQYIRSGCARPDELVTAWNISEAYRILPPSVHQPSKLRLFNSIFKIPLATVTAPLTEHRQPREQQNSFQPPSPGR